MKRQERGLNPYIKAFEREFKTKMEYSRFALWMTFSMFIREKSNAIVVGCMKIVSSGCKKQFFTYSVDRLVLFKFTHPHIKS